MSQTWRFRLLLAAVALASCQQPTPPPTSTSMPTPVASSASPTSAVSPVPTGSTRTTVLNAANQAFSQGEYASAAELYTRVLNSPPTAGESPELSQTIDGLSRFRLLLADVLLARDDQAQQQLRALQGRDPQGVFARLASQFLDQYGMAGGARGACNSVRPQVHEQAGPELARLRDAGVSIDPDALCSVPR